MLPPDYINRHKSPDSRSDAHAYDLKRPWRTPVFPHGLSPLQAILHSVLLRSYLSAQWLRNGYQRFRDNAWYMGKAPRQAVWK